MSDYACAACRDEPVLASGGLCPRCAFAGRQNTEAAERLRDLARADAATLREHAEALAAALDDLLVWAEWIKAHIHRAPRMNEPNTGARLQASQTLTRWREGPGREKGAKP